MFRSHLFQLVLLALVVGCTSESNLTHVDGLGSIDFPNSGNQAAQEPFYRGVLLMHSFEFTSSAEAFLEAQEADPAFALAYWGEAMTYNHPLWQEKDVAAAHGILSRMDAAGAVGATEREQGYINAVRVLYADGTKGEQDSTYMDTMEALSMAYPEDDEARAFYSLSVLGSTDGARDFDVYERGASIARPIFERNPNHPGAAHYLIHSYDDPGHAHLGLAAADAYSEIAPGAAHAQHMTTHIFLAQGNWRRVIDNNIRAMNVSDEGRAKRGLRPGVCGHYSSWRHYGHLQLGEMDEAEAMMGDCFERISDSDHSTSEWFYFSGMRAHHLLSRELWDRVGDWMPELESLPESHVLAGVAFTNGLMLLKSGDIDGADAWRAHIGAGRNPMSEILFSLFDGYRLVVSGEVEAGLEMLRSVAEREASMPLEFGPPSNPKPTHELLAEALVETGNIAEAIEVYEIASSRTPKRWILGKADGLRVE